MTLFEHRDRIITEIFKPAFKAAGFKVSGNTFSKTEQGFIKVFNIQSSGFNNKDSVSFYLNIGMLFPIFYEIWQKEPPKNPKEHDCLIRLRSNVLTGRNQRYDLESDTNIVDLESSIRKDLEEFVLPFFNRYNDIEDCLTLESDIPTIWSGYRPFVAMTMIKNGKVEKGNALLNDYLPTASPDWAQRLNTFRQQLLS